jgi:sortase A
MDFSKTVTYRVGWLQLAEALSWLVAISCLVAWGILVVSGAVGSRLELRRFEATQVRPQFAVASPDLSLWSPQRILAWHDTLSQPASAPLGVLRLRRLGLEVPVLEGTDDWTLNRGAGHITDTAVPGAEGNTGIAGHRDGFFRVLKDIEQDDVLELETLRGVGRYRVQRTWIVDPEDVSVLDPTDFPSMTLVTCFPFYFVGSAPQRFIVRAVRADSNTATRLD